MSLNWDITRCDPAAKSDANWPTTDAFVWMTMALGLRELTEKNETEWKTRLAMWSATEGGNKKSAFENLLALPAAEWELRYGLSANVVNTTRTAFKKRVADFLEREAVARLRREAVASYGR